jgi:hypothetical protein
MMVHHVLPFAKPGAARPIASNKRFVFCPKNK